jgi:hypothetical protein
MCCRSYFTSRFPNLLMAAYCFGLRHCADEPMLAKYYPQGARDFPMPLELMSARMAKAAGVGASAADTIASLKV